MEDIISLMFPYENLYLSYLLGGKFKASDKIAVSHRKPYKISRI
ncbi:MAG: hypothetical protein WCY05_05010 [Candidatus Omnitrophota bacterium]